MNRDITRDGEQIAGLIMADTRLSQLAVMFSRSGFQIHRVRFYSTKRGLTVRVIWRMRSDDQTASFAGTFKFPIAKLPAGATA
jgi:hypothetical protein